MATTRRAVKRFRRGLVVGKFSPLHRGHERVIRWAFDECDEVVIISYSNPEFPGCEATRREQWLAQLFPEATRLVLDNPRATNDAPPLPPNDAPDDVHRAFVAGLLTDRLGMRVDAVFTSESYGDGFAAHLTMHFRRADPSVTAVTHVLVDASRATIPISGTQIRTDLHAHREWLPPEVYASFVRRVCLLGGESSGKSVLSRALAERHGTQFVPEYGRDLWTRKRGVLEFDDLLSIATTQVALEEAAARQANKAIFCDTSPLTTLFYSLDLFGRAHPGLEALAGRRYDSYVLCAPDFPFVQDGTRRDEAFRQRQHDWYVQQLNQRGIEYVLATGPIEARIAQLTSA